MLNFVLKPPFVIPRGGLPVALVLASLSLSVPILADDSADVTAEDRVLEVVVVTARKVRENVQDIPLSIQVLSGEQLDEADLSNLFGLQHLVPGLVLNTAGLFGAGFALRGVSDQGGMHLNGVYLGSSQLAIARMFDLDRIEVLKGPQGTLYGRNANGGSINFITRAPEDEFGGELEGAYGSFNTTRVQGHVNIPLGSATTRFAFIGSEGDGFIRNSVDDRRFGEADYWGLRGSLAFDPSELWHIEFTAQRVYDDGAATELWLPNVAYLPDPDDIHLTRVTLENPFLRTENDFANLTAEYDLGFASVRSITGYARNETNNLDDCQGLPGLVGCSRGGDPLIYRQWSQELQLASVASERLEWLAGLYYYSEESREHFFRLNTASPLPLEDSFSTEDNTAWAVFSHANLHLGGNWGISGGVRLSDEENRVSRIGTGLFDDPDLVVAAGSWDQPSWRLDLEYTVRDGLLYYAGVSTGFRSGGITTVRLPDDTFDSYKPEDLLAYEVGLKSQWPELGLMVDAAVFHYDFDDLQTINRYFTSDGQVIVDIDNAAKAEVNGIDVAASLQATDRLSLAAALIWLPKREYVDYVVNEDSRDLSGNKLPRAPEWSAVGSISYRWPLAQYGELTGRLEYSYRSEFFYTQDNLATEKQEAYGLLNLYLGFEPQRGDWYAFATGRNLTDEDYFHQVFIQSAPGYPDTYEVGIGVRF